MIFDCVPINDELDMLECRIVELENIPDLVHVIVEGDVTHQGNPKPYWLTDNLDRFDQWKDRIVVVRATGLPTVKEAPDPWAREYATREFCGEGLIKADCADEDVVLHGDLDEVPRALIVRNVRPKGYVSFSMTGHFWSLRWRYGPPWLGTVAARAGSMTTFCAMRDARVVAPQIQEAGWHLSWLGGREMALTKVDSFCHPETKKRVVEGVESGRFIRDGWHLDGIKMDRCEIDETFPKWVREGRCPASWLV